FTLSRILSCLSRSLLLCRRFNRLLLLRAEIAPLKERHAHRLEVLRPHPEHPARGVCARSWSVARYFDIGAASRNVETEQETIRDTGRSHSWERFEPRQQLFVQAGLLRHTQTVAGINRKG